MRRYPHPWKRTGVLFVCLLLSLGVAAPADAARPGTESGRIVRKLPDGAHPDWLAVASDGTVWFSGQHTYYYEGGRGESSEGFFLGQLSPGGKLTETSLAKGEWVGPPVAIPGSGVWFPESHEDAQGNEIFEIAGFPPAGGTQRYVLDAGVTEVDAMTTMGGDLWFAGSAVVEGSARGVVARVALAAAGAVTLFPLEPGCGAGEAIAATADAIWFGESCPAMSSSDEGELERSNLGRIDSSGAVTRRPLPPGDRPIAAATSSDGSVWIGMQNNSVRGPARLVHVEATGSLRQFGVRGANFRGMAVAAEGRLWFSSTTQQLRYDHLASIGPAGHRSRPDCLLKSSYCSSGVNDLATGPEGTLWFAAGLAPFLGIGGGGGSGLIEAENLGRAPGYIGRVG